MKAFNSIFLVNTGIIFLYFSNNVFAKKSCNVNVKMKQELLNEGFHRNLTYRIVFNSDDEDDWMYKGCIVVLDQKLPAGVFANPDELEDIRRYYRLKVLIENKKVNVELPAEQSEPNNVYIFGKIRDNNLYLWIPLHARYHRAVTGGGSVRNKIEAPKMYLRCRDLRLDQCAEPLTPQLMFLCQGTSDEKCSAKKISYTKMTDTLIWEVPVGDLEHYYVVAIGTALAVVAGSVYLLRAAHEFHKQK